MRDQSEVPGVPVGSLYSVLGVAPGASQETIVHTYRQKARDSHPDARPDDPGATARFRMLTSAYQVLSDPGRRADYDRRTGSAAGLVPQSSGYWRGQEWLQRTGEPPFGGRNPSDVFLRARPTSSSGQHLWAGPVRVEATPREPFGEFQWPQASRHRDLDGLTSLLLGFLTDAWSE